jgi:Tfp pilus assembly protein PilF
MKKRRRRFYLAGFVSLAAFIVYLSSLRNKFIVWDDDRYIFENSHIHALNPAFFRWAFFDFYAGNWHPLTWISHALDYAVWGLNPLGHHLTNIILHAVNTFVVVLLAARLLEVGASPKGEEYNPTHPPLSLRGGEGGVTPKGVLIAAVTTGLLFGLHPLHVESVAWVSERKDLLCALFFLLSVMMYVRYAGRSGPAWPPGEGQPHRDAPTRNDPGQAGMTRSGPQFLNRDYLLALVFFILALMSKPMAVTLPLVLLVLDWYPFERVSSLRTFRTALVEKLPFIGLSLASAVLTVFAQRAGGTIRSTQFAPLSTRVLVGFKSLITYLWKMVWPMNLVPFYPYPKNASLLSIEYLSSIVLVLGITVACIILARKRKLWLSAWGYYVITLLPVLGIVQVGLQSMADRYTYLPSLGPFLLVGITAAWVWARLERFGKKGLAARAVAFAVSVCVVVSLSYMTFRQTGIWRNSIVFWSYVIEKEPGRVPLAYNNRGVAYKNMGLLNNAIADFDRAIALDPLEYKAYNNRGVLYKDMGLLDMAIGDYDKAIQIMPDRAGTYISRGIAYSLMGRNDRALKDFDKAIFLSSDNYEAYLNRGAFYFSVGDYSHAVSDFQRACELGSREGCRRFASMTR